MNNTVSDLNLFVLTLNEEVIVMFNFLKRTFNLIILSIIFFTIISPLAIIFRILGRDKLLLNQKNIKSYWKFKNHVDLKLYFFKKQS